MVNLIDVMNVTTTGGNVYTYDRLSNKIVGGDVICPDDEWEFGPLMQFASLPDVDTYVLGVTEQCNLRCAYCCYSGSYPGNRVHSPRAMSESDVESILNFIDEMSPDCDIRLSFYGGEPLLNFSVVKRMVVQAVKCWGNRVTFSISTNATLLAEEVVDWLVAKNIELAISIDGVGEYHDENRIDSKGKGSFARVRKALQYIYAHYPDYYNRLTIIMTRPSFDSIDKVAESWHNDALLRNLTPTMINGLAPNFEVGVNEADYNSLREMYTKLLDVYEQHQDWNVLKVLFSQCVAYWHNRPILSPSGPVPMATCLPLNTKLYIDTSLNIGVCEKMSDSYRIGKVGEGIDLRVANAMVSEYYNRRVKRCKYCPAVRMCDMCLTAIEFSDEQWDLLCHNERVYMRLNMYLYCEMAERGLLR